MQKMRVRNHQVVLNRSVGGDAGIAFFLIIMGISLLALSFCIDGSDFKEFVSGFLMGISVVEMILGIYLLGKTMNHNRLIYKLKVLVNQIFKRW